MDPIHQILKSKIPRTSVHVSEHLELINCLKKIFYLPIVIDVLLQTLCFGTILFYLEF